MTKKGWEEFFDGHASRYMGEVFVKNAREEVDFLMEELKLQPGNTILDVGCGTGRHAVEFARRGFKMTGVDLSSGMLAEAEKAAASAGVTIELVHNNAAAYKPDKKFDAAICLCEGAFSLLGLGDDPIERDLMILRNVNAALDTGGKFIITVPNAMQKIRKYKQEDVASGNFDPVHVVESVEMEYDSGEGKRKVHVREKGYIGSELKLFLRLAGFRTENIWGGTAGDWGRREIKLDEIEIMAVAVKEAEN